MSVFASWVARSAALLSLAFSASALADNTTTTQLDTITVAGNGSEISLKNNPASVSVLERKQIEQQGASSVAELLRDVPGVVVADSSAAGMQRIRMRGESSRRVTILVDGQEITDHSTFGTPILINPSSIERIEVVRGPASVLYGAKAIGGVINIITRKGAEQPIELEVSGSYHSASKGQQGLVAISGQLNNLDYRLSASGEDHGDRQVASGPYSSTSALQGSSFNNSEMNLHLGYLFGSAANQYLSVKANLHQLSTDSWTDPATLSFPIEEFNIWLPKRDLSKFGLYYQAEPVNSIVKKIQADAYYQWVDRDFANHVVVNPGVIKVAVDSRSVDRNLNYGGRLQVDLALYEKHQLVLGAQYLMDDLDTQKTSLQFIDDAFDSFSSTNTQAQMQTLSAFAFYQWQLPADFNLHAGSRFYRVVSDATTGEKSTHLAVVSSLGLTYSGLKRSTARLLYSEGYIMPTLLQMYTNTSAGRGVTTYGNPQLSPETSQNLELGWRYTNHGFMLDMASFYTKAKDYISTISCAESLACPSGAQTSEYVNINADRAQSYGLEFQLEYNLNALLLTPYISGTWMRREITQGDFTTLHSDTPLFSGKAGARYEHYFAQHELWLDIYVRGASQSSYQESANAQVSTLAGYHTLHVSLGQSLGNRSQYQWSLHANNLLNRSYRASSDELPGAGRSFIASLSAKF
ncbi:MAG: TonB-dependent receptor [Venatoribacter sp.]